MTVGFHLQNSDTADVLVRKAMRHLFSTAFEGLRELEEGQLTRLSHAIECELVRRERDEENRAPDRILASLLGNEDYKWMRLIEGTRSFMLVVRRLKGVSNVVHGIRNIDAFNNKLWSICGVSMEPNAATGVAVRSDTFWPSNMGQLGELLGDSFHFDDCIRPCRRCFAYNTRIADVGRDDWTKIPTGDLALGPVRKADL